MDIRGSFNKWNLNKTDQKQIIDHFEDESNFADRNDKLFNISYGTRNELYLGFIERMKIMIYNIANSLCLTSDLSKSIPNSVKKNFIIFKPKENPKEKVLDYLLYKNFVVVFKDEFKISLYKINMDDRVCELTQTYKYEQSSTIGRSPSFGYLYFSNKILISINYDLTLDYRQEEDPKLLILELDFDDFDEKVLRGKNETKFFKSLSSYKLDTNYDTLVTGLVNRTLFTFGFNKRRHVNLSNYFDFFSFGELEMNGAVSQDDDSMEIEDIGFEINCYDDVRYLEREHIVFNIRVSPLFIAQVRKSHGDFNLIFGDDCYNLIAFQFSKSSPKSASQLQEGFDSDAENDKESKPGPKKDKKGTKNCQLI